MEVLIAGGAGFVGSYVCELLSKQGYNIHVLDNKSNYSPIDNNVQQSNKKYLDKKRQNIKHYHHIDTQDYLELVKLLSDFSFDAIVHLAAMPLATVAIERPALAYDVISTGTRNLLEAMRITKNNSRFVYVSSSMVYGDFIKETAYESDPCNPKDIYGSFKYCGEIITQAYVQRYGTEATIARPSAVYGRGDSNNRVIQAMATKALLHNKLTVADPNDIRLDFTHVTDLAFILATLANPKMDIMPGEIFNVTRGKARSLGEIVDIIRLEIPSVDVEIISNKEDFRPKRGTLSNTKIKNIIGNYKFSNVEEKVPEYINYLREILL